MNVILLERLNNLGDLGDEVSVKPGFARNFLIPQQKRCRPMRRTVKCSKQRRAELEKVPTTSWAKPKAVLRSCKSILSLS